MTHLKDISLNYYVVILQMLYQIGYFFILFCFFLYSGLPQLPNLGISGNVVIVCPIDVLKMLYYNIFFSHEQFIEYCAIILLNFKSNYQQYIKTSNTFQCISLNSQTIQFG